MIIKVDDVSEVRSVYGDVVEVEFDNVVQCNRLLNQSVYFISVFTIKQTDVVVFNERMVSFKNYATYLSYVCQFFIQLYYDSPTHY